MKKRILLTLLMLFLLFISLVSCSAGESDAMTDAEGNAADASSAEYRIVYEKNQSKAANRIRNSIYKITKKAPECTSDASIESPNEILIGDTGRAESTEFISTLGEYEYGVRVKQTEGGTKIIIAGKKSGYAPLAAEIFLAEYLKEGQTSVELQKTEDTIMENTEEKNNDLILSMEEIKWTGNNITVKSGGYARLCELPNGDLACVYTAGGYVRFCTSSNKGMSWSEHTNVIKIDKTPNGQDMALGNANMVVMADGTYMLAFRAHTAGSDYSEFYTSIRYCLSRDGGKSWSDDIIVAENLHVGSQFTGFWEPHMIYIKGGVLAMYYASDCIGGDAEGYPFVSSMTYQHIIVHLYDEATGRFGEPMIASNGELHNSRDGMPVVCELSDGTYAMVIESSSMRGTYPFIIQILFSEDGIVWSEPKTIWKPSKSGEYAGAPYITLLDDGRIAVSFQATENSGSTIGDSSVHNSAMNVIISKEIIGYKNRDSISQKDFDTLYFQPIETSIGNSYSIWPAMLAYDGKLYCIAECGVNNSKTSRTSKGLILRIGEYK